MFDKPTVGLALGGGAARGLAHVGVLKVLERERIPVDLIVGTSMGAVVGGAYAFHNDASLVEERLRGFAQSEDFKRDRFEFLKEGRSHRPNLMHRVSDLLRRGVLYGYSLTMPSFVSAQQLEHNLSAVLEDVDIRDTLVPFAAVALDIVTGDTVVMDGGPLRLAVGASSAIPGVLPPIEVKDHVFIDGGWSDKLPVLPAEVMGADLVIAVNVSREVEQEFKSGNALDVMVRSRVVTSETLNRMQKVLADVLIEPEVMHVHWADFTAVGECIEMGERAARAALDEIREALDSANRRRTWGRTWPKRELRQTLNQGRSLVRKAI